MDEMTRKSFEDQLTACMDLTRHLVIQQQIWRGLVELAHENEWICEPPTIFQFITNCYYDSLALGIRRLFDTHDDAISLRKLLRRIGSGEVRFTREWFIDRWPGTRDCADSRERAIQRWESIAGVGRSVLDAARVKEQVGEITAIAGEVLAYVDKRIAHFDKRETPAAPPFDAVDKALTVAVRLQNDYFLLATGGGIQLDEIMFQYNWKIPLYFPWAMSARYHIGLQMPVHPEGAGQPEYWRAIEGIRRQKQDERRASEEEQQPT